MLREAPSGLQRSILNHMSDINDSAFVGVVSDLAARSLGKQPTGPFRRTKNLVPTGKLTSFNLNDFEKATGQHWVSLTMSVDLVGLKASVRGEACAAEMNPNASASELSDR